VISGGVKLIPITTPKGTFKVWTKRIGNNPKIKVLLLHGGPGSPRGIRGGRQLFPGAGVEYYYYDQLGSYYSDQPTDSSLWTCRGSWRGRTGAPGAQARQHQLSSCWGSRGAGCWRWSKRSSTSST
jgi:hypothetical protein